MSNQESNDKKTFSHYTFITRCIFKGFTKNASGTLFASIALPSGQVDDKQAYINVSAIVGNNTALKSLASSIVDLELNDGKGTSAEVTLSDLKASHAFDSNGAIRLDNNGQPFINYTAFLNGIAFS